MDSPNLDEYEEITDVTFDHENAHLAVVHKQQAGAANGWHTSLIIKASEDNVPSDVIKALEQVTVKLSMEEFLRKFFDMYYDSAELLTKLLGFETEYEYRNSEGNEPTSHIDYLDEKISKISIMKSAYEGSLDIYDLPTQDILDIIKCQEKFEIALNKAVIPHQDNRNEETLMDIKEFMKSAEGKELLAALKTEAVQEVEKAKNTEIEAIQADLTKASQELEKAAAELEAFRTEKEAKRKEGVQAFVKSLTFIKEDADQESLVEAIFKAKDIEGMEVIVSAFEKAQAEFVAVKEEFVKSEDEGFESKDEQTVEIDKATELTDMLVAKYAGKDFI